MPRNLRLYLLIVFIAGMAVWIWMVPSIHTDVLYELLILAMMAGFMDKYCVELPNGTLFSGSSIFTFTALMIYGLPEAMLVEVFIAVSGAVLERIQMTKVLFNMGQYLLAIFVAGNTYIWCGGTPGDFTLAEMPALMLALLLYLAVNLTLVSGPLAVLSSKSFFTVWVESLQDTVLIFLTTFLLSTRLGLIHHAEHQGQFWLETVFIFVIFMALRYAFRLFLEMRKTYLASLESFTMLAENKLSTGDGHAARVGRLSRQLAEALKLPQSEIDTIHYAALFHDVGKIRVKSSIFTKRGPLTVDEEKEYRRHAEYGAKMLQDISGLEKAAEYVRYHHENWDGSGYPLGLKAENIPVGARIIAAASEYDKLLVNHRGSVPEQAYRKLANHRLDPALVSLVMTVADVHLETERTEPVDHALKDDDSKQDSGVRPMIEKSELLCRLGDHLFAVYQGGDLCHPDGGVIQWSLAKQLLPLIKKAQRSARVIREFVRDEQMGRIYDFYGIPVQQDVFVCLFEVTTLLEYESRQRASIQSMYQEVLFAVTQGKLLLTDESGIQPYHRGELLAMLPIREKRDVAACRELVSEILSRMNIPEKNRFSILLCTSEAVTNVLKHAVDGRMKIYRDDHSLRVVVEDNGSGMELANIPKATLMSGYSTQLSMGQGFSLMLKLMDQVILKSDAEGTTVVLEVRHESISVEPVFPGASLPVRKGDMSSEVAMFMTNHTGGAR